LDGLFSCPSIFFARIVFQTLPAPPPIGEIRYDNSLSTIRGNIDSRYTSPSSYGGNMDETMRATALASLNDERNGAYLYDALASAEKDLRLAEVYRRMAAVERRHADEWVDRLKSDGVDVPGFSPNWRSKTLAWAARRLGVATVLPTVIGNERKDSRKYAGIPGSAGMAADESSHNRLLSQVAATMKGGIEGGALAQLEGRHRAGGGNALRAAVLGANDGLVSIFSLVMGVAGAELNNKVILITGFAGLLAGAISMALGEWLSVQSSRELYKHQIGIEKQELAAVPEEEAEELALIYEARGVPKDEAQRMAQHIISSPESALETLAREELSVDPNELGGSAWEAALTSFLLFSIGAIIPIIPYTFLTGTLGILVSMLFSAIGLFVVGAAITLFTGKSVFYSGARQVLFGLAAAAVTFGIGRLIGVNVGG
jgi:VIT1/CCC1 family predicted Fe2+/Mn2+ transporter